MNLSELIQAQKAGRSYRQLAVDCGGAIAAQRLQQLATVAQREFPSADTIRGLARGLRVSEATVVLAAADSLGLDVARGIPRLVEMLPPAAQSLSDRQAAAIAEVVRSFTEAREGGGGDERDAASMTKAGGPSAGLSVRELRRRRDAARRAGNEDIAASYEQLLQAVEEAGRGAVSDSRGA